MPAVPAVVTLAVLGHHRRVVEDLLGEAAPPVVLAPVALERLVKKRIEWFSSSDCCGTEIAYVVFFSEEFILKSILFNLILTR